MDTAAATIQKTKKSRVGLGPVFGLWVAVFAFFLLIALGVTSLLAAGSAPTAALNDPTLIARAPSGGAESAAAVSGATAVAPLAKPNNVAGLAATIKIAKIGVNAPVVFSQSTDLKYLAVDLAKGVIVYPGSAMPGGPGNVFITGHSSGQVWDPNPYKRVFAKLGQLKPGDEIEIVSGGQSYTYRVRSVMVLRPDEIRVFQPSASPMLTLSTCWPIGSATNRFVVEADLVS